MGKRILLADDSITIQKVIELTFSDEDFEVVTVGNGRLAVERLTEVRPDLVLCDIIMPEKDGYEVCEHVKRTPEFAHIPVLLLTGAFEPFDQERAGRVGADGYLAKPFEPETLVARVKELLARGPAPVAMAAAAPPSLAPALPRPVASTPLTASAPVATAWVPVASPPLPAPTPAMSAAAVPSPFPVGAEAQTQKSPAPPPVKDMPFFAEADEDDLGGATISFSPGGTFPAAPPPLPSTAAPSFISDEPFGDVDKAPAGPIAAADAAASMPADGPRAQAKPEATGPQPSVSGGPALLPPPVPAGAQVSPPVVSWSAPTVEVPLEVRAQASVEAAQGPSTPVFDDVFEAEVVEYQTDAYPTADATPFFVLAPGSRDFAPEAKIAPHPEDPPPSREEPAASVAEEAPNLAPEDLLADVAPPVATQRDEGAGAASAEELVSEPTVATEVAPPKPPPLPPPLRAPEPVQVVREPSAPLPPLAAAVAVAETWEDLATAVAAPREAAASGLPSVTGGISVPSELVAQIAQRVIAQISEKVVREVAWEVVPDLAEALIRKEIERLTAELGDS